jgi:hypothetical protein
MPKSFNELMKKTYENIYSFQVIDAILDEKSVFILDKARQSVYDATLMPICEIARILKMEKEEPNRFGFWIEKEDEKDA